MDRNLDGCYFRVQRDGKWCNICFSDLTEDERNTVMEGRETEWFRSLCCYLADRLKKLGDDLEISCVIDDGDD